jgi:hypothetical protein
MREAEATVLRQERMGNGHGAGGDRFKWSR